jgi:glycogen debranching enzyme
VAEDRSAARSEARGWLSPLWDHLRDAGLNFISEIFDGDPPHAPKGCIAQAWSVAEILRAAVEDLQMACPPLAGKPDRPVRNRSCRQ